MKGVKYMGLKIPNVKPGDVLDISIGLIPTSKAAARFTGASLSNTLSGTWNEDFTKFTVGSISGDGSIVMSAVECDGVNFSNLALGSTFLFGKHQVNTETPWDIEWEIVHQEDDYQIAQTVQLIDVRAFDGKEASSTDSYRKTSGNNNWKISNIRQWLNSDASAGNWYSAQHTYDAPPIRGNVGEPDASYDTRPGFLYHFTAAQKSTMMNFDLTLAVPSVDGGGSHVVSQKVFLPTMTQVGLGANESVTEGTVFSKYNGVENSGRIKTAHPMAVANSGYDNAGFIANNRFYWWLSSANTSTSYNVIAIDTPGSRYGSGAFNGFLALAPCICLPRTGICPF